MGRCREGDNVQQLRVHRGVVWRAEVGPKVQREGAWGTPSSTAAPGGEMGTNWLRISHQLGRLDRCASWSRPVLDRDFLHHLLRMYTQEKKPAVSMSFRILKNGHSIAQYFAMTLFFYTSRCINWRNSLLRLLQMITLK